ncbi:MAG: hypothetical protein K2J11_05250, partial [Oscillospiraceae bacterium]|nr:hypothetical protein [Oscillospiraceae bacterium]
MNNKLKDEHMDALFKAILTLENTEECYKFFEDLCTVLELKAMSQRMQVATMLVQKRVYSDIVAETGASTATISLSLIRVSEPPRPLDRGYAGVWL